MSFRFTGADAAVLAWYRWQATAEAPAALDPVALRGIQCLKACRRCRGRVHHEVPSSDGGFVWRCRHCGELWPLREVCLGRGKQNGGRVLSYSPKIERAAELDLVLAATPRPDADVYAFWLLDGGAGGWTGTARRANARQVDGAPWRAMTVKRAVRRSRRWIDAELRLRGWL